MPRARRRGHTIGGLLTTTSKEELKEVLRARLEELYAAGNGFPILLAHGLPDYVLQQLSFDVYEQASAALLIADSPLPRAGVANARAALEAALDMYALLAEPSMYDEMGASVRVCELLAKEDLRKHGIRASDAIGRSTPLPETRSPEELVDKEAAEWEAYQPGVGTMYNRVLAQAREDGRWKSHWSGLGNLQAVIEYVQRKQGAPPGFKEMAYGWYRTLTHASHPGPRTGSRSVNREIPGQLTFGPKAGNERLPLAGARFACEHATHALRLRLTLFKAT